MRIQLGPHPDGVGKQQDTGDDEDPFNSDVSRQEAPDGGPHHIAKRERTAVEAEGTALHAIRGVGPDQRIYTGKQAAHADTHEEADDDELPD
ncbi:hypothetical protein D3C81_1634340 [compost metagenome]